MDALMREIILDNHLILISTPLSLSYRLKDIAEELDLKQAQIVEEGMIVHEKTLLIIDDCYHGGLTDNERYMNVYADEMFDPQGSDVEVFYYYENKEEFDDFLKEIVPA